MDPSVDLSRPGDSVLNSVLRLTRHGTRVQLAIGRLLPRVGDGHARVLFAGAWIVQVGVLVAGCDLLGRQLRLLWGPSYRGRLGHRVSLLGRGTGPGGPMCGDASGVSTPGLR